MFQRSILFGWCVNIPCAICRHRLTSHSVVRNLSTTSQLLKHTPATVGIMSWVRSANRRKYIEQKMKEVVKSEHQVLKEEQLAQSTPKIEFRTSNRIYSRMNEQIMHSHLIKPTVFLSKDKETIICYHPPPKPYPEKFTKRAVGESLFGFSQDLLNTFKSSMTEEEVIEAKNLQSKDPRLWNRNALARLFKVKPEIISLHVPMTKHHFQIAEAEKEVYKSMSVMKRKQFRDLQQWERHKYIRKTRGNEFASWYKKSEVKPRSRAYVPPKL